MGKVPGEMSDVFFLKMAGKQRNLLFSAVQGQNEPFSLCSYLFFGSSTTWMCLILTSCWLGLMFNNALKHCADALLGECYYTHMFGNMYILEIILENILGDDRMS